MITQFHCAIPDISLWYRCQSTPARPPTTNRRRLWPKKRTSLHSCRRRQSRNRHPRRSPVHRNNRCEPSSTNRLPYRNSRRLVAPPSSTMTSASSGSNGRPNRRRLRTRARLRTSSSANRRFLRADRPRCGRGGNGTTVVSATLVATKDACCRRTGDCGSTPSGCGTRADQKRQRARAH